MPFFDKKEDVLDIKLTPYGRHLLSKGKLMPKYYTFLDDDIIYDVKHVNSTEQNNQIKERIINETPSLKPLYTMNSVETELQDNDMYNWNGPNQPDVTKFNYTNPYDASFRPAGDMNTKFLQNVIGTSKHTTNKAPRWDCTLIRGEIKTALNYTSSLPNNHEWFNSPSASVIHIPQLGCEVEYTIEVKNTNTQTDGGEADESLANLSPHLQSIQVYEDGTYLNITEDQIISNILEKNGFMHDDSYNIEVFEVEENQLTQLKFVKKQKKIVNDILLDNPFSSQVEPDSRTVEYYFDIRVDEEIEEYDICQGVSELRSEGIYINDFNIICEDVQYNLPITTVIPTDPDCEDEGNCP
tara:strand:- start:878 stop:1939 length:1062 start_codon:yes stop_codon:yes gene_type:complete